MLDWTPAQRAEIARHYERIGYKPGDRWPAPGEHLSTEKILELLRAIPDRAGLAGWLAALASTEKKQ